MGILNLFKKLTRKHKINDSQRKNQYDMAEKLYKSDPKLATRVAMGEEKPPEGILAAAIYGKVCDEVEKSKDIEASIRLANSDHNLKISAEAQNLKFRDPYSAIEKMKEVVNARREAFEGTLPSGETYESTKEKMQEELRSYLFFLENCIEFLVDTEKTIKSKINEIETKTEQDVKKEQLAKEIWILRYAFLYSLFFEIKTPKNENETIENDKLINHALKNILKKEDKNDYLPWLQEGFNMLIDPPINYKNFQSQFPEKVGEKIPSIAFECTNGKLGGKSHDSILELIMITIEKDKKFFLN
jgi:hypothetical protein